MATVVTVPDDASVGVKETSSDPWWMFWSKNKQIVITLKIPSSESGGIKVETKKVQVVETVSVWCG